MTGILETPETTILKTEYAGTPYRDEPYRHNVDVEAEGECGVEATFTVETVCGAFVPDQCEIYVHYGNNTFICDYDREDEPSFDLWQIRFAADNFMNDFLLTETTRYKINGEPVFVSVGDHGATAYIPRMRENAIVANFSHIDNALDYLEHNYG